MKNIFLVLVVFSFLFPSCFSYREVEKNDSSKQIGLNYKVRSNGKSYTGKLVSFNDSIITFNNGFKDNEFKISDIQKIQRKKFSILKTVGFTVGVPVFVAGVFVATSDINVNVAPTSPN